MQAVIYVGERWVQHSGDVTGKERHGREAYSGSCSTQILCCREAGCGLNIFLGWGKEVRPTLLHYVDYLCYGYVETTNRAKSKLGS